VTASLLHDNVGYTPYEGRRITGWPTAVFSRGRAVVRDGALLAERGSGSFVPRGRPEPLRTLAPSAQRGAFSALVGLKHAS
jgi:dihydropyrimidinase